MICYFKNALLGNEGVKKFESLNDLPIAVMPNYFDNRIIAQKSCFLFFGKDQTPIEEMNNTEYYFKLARISIDNGSVELIKNELITIGVSYYSLFPDLHGLARDVKYSYLIRKKK